MLSIPASEELLDKKIAEAFEDLETTFIGRILEFNHVIGTATVQPISNDFDSTNEVYNVFDPILNVPVSMIKTKHFYIRPPYEVGDLVMCSINKDALDDLLVKNIPVNSAFAELGKFEMTDAIVVQGMWYEEEGGMLAGNAHDLVIVNRNTGDQFIMKDSGGVKIKANVEIQGSLTVTETIDAGDTIHSDVDVTGASVSLENHTHTYTHNTTDDRTTRPANY